MGDSGGAASDGTEPSSDGDGGSFEFDNVDGQAGDGSEKEDSEPADELSGAVDFSLGMDDVEFGEDDASDADPPDGPDAPAGKTDPGTTGATPASAENAAPTTGSPTKPEGQQAASNGTATEAEPSTTDENENSGDDPFYDIDPVDESEKAFNFAEKQSKAAYEFAYKEATQNPLTKVLRKYTSREVRERLDQVFSRKMLGSVFIGMSATNIVMVSVDAYLRENPTVPWWEPLLWVGIFLASVAIFVWWERLARKATEAANQAAESATEAASEAAESASQKAEAASEAASQAAETATGSDGSTTNSTAGSKPTKLNGTAQTAGGYTTEDAGTHRAPARRRAPDRRPNKRFHSDDTRQEQLSTYENGDEFEQVELEDLPQQGGGFKNAGEREPRGTQPSADDD